MDVKLILPGIPDKKAAYALAKSHYASLTDAGVKIYEYTPGFVHAKVFVSDDCRAVVGTITSTIAACTTISSARPTSTKRPASPILPRILKRRLPAAAPSHRKRSKPGSCPTNLWEAL